MAFNDFLDDDNDVFPWKSHNRFNIGGLDDDRMKPLTPPGLHTGPIVDSSFRQIGNVDLLGNITDNIGRPTNSRVDAFGNVTGFGHSFTGDTLSGGQIRGMNGMIKNDLPDPFKPPF